MLGRALILAACAVVVVLLAGSLSAHADCQGARRELLQIVLGRVPVQREAAAVATVRTRCRGTEGLVAASAALNRQGRLGESVKLAQAAVSREPGSATAWDALAVAAGAAGRRALARRATATAQRLSPLGRSRVPARPAGRARAGGAAAP